MMPKFRVWVSIGNRWISEWRDIYINENGYLYIDRDNKEAQGIEIAQMGNLKYMAVCMSTEIEDMNGIEIYEGDIVKQEKGYSCDGDKIIRYLEVFRDKSGAWRVKYPNTTLANVYDLRNQIEVVGNKFEHPHLLEGEG